MYLSCVQATLPDPSGLTGTDEEIIKTFTELRDVIENYCYDFSNLYTHPLIPDDLDTQSKQFE